MQTLAQKLQSCANYSEARAQEAVVNLGRIRSSLPPTKLHHGEDLLKAPFLSEPVRPIIAYKPYAMRTPPVQKRSVARAFAPITHEPINSIWERYGIRA